MKFHIPLQKPSILLFSRATLFLVRTKPNALWIRMVLIVTQKLAISLKLQIGELCVPCELCMQNLFGVEKMAYLLMQLFVSS